MLVVRPAKTNDVKVIRALVDSYAAPGQMLSKETVTLYESVQEFIVAEVDGVVVGCGALHILWEDLAEVRTMAVKKELNRQGIGHKILEAIIARAGEVGVEKLFCLTFQTEFFGAHGFEVIEGTYPIGIYEQTFDLGSLASGEYVAILNTEKKKIVERTTKIK